jgi:hypothetical protein
MGVSPGRQFAGHGKIRWLPYCLVTIVSDASTSQGVPSTTSVSKPPRSGNATADSQFTLVAMVAPATAEKNT